MTCLIETPVFAWRGWSNPNFRLQGSEVTIRFWCTLNCEVVMFRYKRVFVVVLVFELLTSTIPCH